MEQWAIRRKPNIYIIVLKFINKVGSSETMRNTPFSYTIKYLKYKKKAEDIVQSLMKVKV